ncbi:MAG: hypothetical protein M3Q06_10290 [Bacteroidota bacterium]|nr:hypothetical protein [Bacteroidota bacterium]
MLFIRCYYYVFYAFVYAVVGLCELIGYLNRLHISWPRRKQVRVREWVSMLHLDFGKAH